MSSKKFCFCVQVAVVRTVRVAVGEEEEVVVIRRTGRQAAGRGITLKAVQAGAEGGEVAGVAGDVVADTIAVLATWTGRCFNSFILPLKTS